MSGLLYGMISAFLFGTADFLAGISSRKLGIYSTFYFMQATGLLFLTAVFLLTGQWQTLIAHPGSTAQASLWMGVDAVGIMFLYQSLLKGNAAVVAPVASSFSAVTVVLAYCFGERQGMLAMVGVVLTILGVLVTSLRSTQARFLHKERFVSGTIWAGLAALFLGAAFFGLRFPSTALGGIATVWIGRLQATLLLPLVFLMLKRPINKPQTKDWKWLVPIGVFDSVALVSYNIGLELEQTSIVVTAASLFAIITLLWGVLIWREKLQWNQWIGIGATFTGIIFITI